MVAGRDEREPVLGHEDQVAAAREVAQDLDQPPHVRLVQAGGGLVQQVQGGAAPGDEAHGEGEALDLTARQLPDGASERQVAEPQAPEAVEAAEELAPNGRALQRSAELLVRVTGDLSPGFMVSAVSIVKKDDGGDRRLRSSRSATRVSSEGTARILGLQPGLFRVELKRATQGNRSRGGAAIAWQEMTVRPGAQEISFRAPTFHQLAIHAPDLSKGTSFWLERKDAPSSGYGGYWGGGLSAELDDQHRATIEDVAAGEYELNTWSNSGQSSMDVTVPSGEVLFEVKTINAYRVGSVSEGKLGEAAGLQVGDLVTAVNGKAVDRDSFWSRLTLDLGTEAVRLTVDRNGAVIDVELGPGKPGSNISRQIGVNWEPASR